MSKKNKNNNQDQDESLSNNVENLEDASEYTSENLKEELKKGEDILAQALDASDLTFDRKTRGVVRKFFGKAKSIEVDNLTSLQNDSYDNFLQKGVPANKRKNIGLERVFSEIFPIFSYNKNISLEYIGYEVGDAKYGIEECRKGDLTYSVPVRVKLKRIVRQSAEEAAKLAEGKTDEQPAPVKKKSKKTDNPEDTVIVDVCEQDVHLGAMPLMTDQGSFIISGVERVLVSQLHRAPGAFFEHDQAKGNSAGKILHSARIIPARGSWLDFEFDIRDHLYVRIDKKKKILASTLLMCLPPEIKDAVNKDEKLADQKTPDPKIAGRKGFNKTDLLQIFYKTNKAERVDGGWSIEWMPSEWTGAKMEHDLLSFDPKTGEKEVIVKEGYRLTSSLTKEIDAQGVKNIYIADDQFYSYYSMSDIINPETGEIYVSAADELTSDKIELLSKMGLNTLYLISMNRHLPEVYWRDTVFIDQSNTPEEALSTLYGVFRPGEYPSLNTAQDLFHSLFFDEDKYSLSDVGRVRLNMRLKLDVPIATQVLTRDDFIKIVLTLLEVKAGRDKEDDIDGLQNRRVRSAGELLEVQCYTVMSKIKRLIKERLSSTDWAQLTPHTLFNSQLFISSIKEFLAKSQLSQFMDHTNPLSMLTHTRRLTSLGPGGLSRGHAVMDVRDVHPTYYGKICPIQTPEGANIGLINSLAVSASVDEYGFLQSRYRKVKNKKVTDEIVYLSALNDQTYNIAHADTIMDDKNIITGSLVQCRRGSDSVMVPPEEVDFIDASTSQIVSVASSLIPGLENNDAGRDLMGANMEGQAVPGLFTQAPVVGTGMEKLVLNSTRTSVQARRSGEVIQVEGDRIVIKADHYDAESGLIDIYNLKKFQQSNAGTCINQRAIVSVGDRVQAGEFIADGQSASKGELALGYNVDIAFLSYEGRNFEDSIVVSEKLAQKGVFKSVHIQTFEVAIRDTRNGQQEITADIPDIHKEKLWHLDTSGIIQIGTEVRPGMILVGRVTPRVETPISGEDKLIRAIFKNSVASVKDDSLYVPAGVTGTVVDVKVFTKKGGAMDARTAAMNQMEIFSLQKDRDFELETLKNSFDSVLKQTVSDQIVKEADKAYLNLKAGDKITSAHLEKININSVKHLKLKDKVLQDKLDFILSQHKSLEKVVQDKFLSSVDKLKSGIDLPPGVLKIVKVYVAMKRSVQSGDKLAGRHGNKGVISYVLPVEDMPHRKDGTPVDMVLSPLGVVSRMNLGQILEIHLGRASQGLTDKIKKMVYSVACQRLANDAAKQSQDLENALNGDESQNDISVQYDAYDPKIAQYSAKDLREYLTKLYKNEKDHIDSLDDDELVRWGSEIADQGVHFASPVFDGARETDVHELLELAGMDKSGQEVLYDGKTGEAFDSPVTVGTMYMLKLHHLVEDKMHARSTGPYSSVTLQPLGGKAQDGGQRDGEMENWAFQAYGAAYILLEMMTLKSDDVVGRIAAFEAITQDRPVSSISVPVVFQVFTKELEALCLSVNCISREIPLRDGWHRSKDITKIAISLSSPQEILARSYGEPTKPETIHYRQQKPEKDGLLCQRIFGPVRDYECACGKYRKIKYRGTICEKCGVEVTNSWVRRERPGHITLASPVIHTWFYRIMPSRLCLVLDMAVQDVDAIINFDRYIIIDPGMTMLHYGQLLTEEEYRELCAVEGPESFVADTGVEAIEKLLKNINLEKEITLLKDSLGETTLKSKRKKLVARYKLLQGFYENNIKPEWMVLRVLPVLPAELRPIVSIEGGRYASSDLNELYRRLINRNNRFKRLIELKAPEILIRNQKRLLQEAVDNLFDNSRRDRPVLGANKRPLRSLSDMLKGKQGRFRQNLLGKRVDYSGRSVIAVESRKVKLHQCGLPRSMALELFKPFVYARLIKDGITLTLRDAKRMVDEERPEVWDALEEVVYRHPVLLNRAPTLHRLGIRAFEPILIDGKAIRLHPLVCSAFNADFDGDQMAVHVPLSIEAQLEARLLMLGTNNILNPANGKPAILPSKDMILGLYYLTYMKDEEADTSTLRKFYAVKDVVQLMEYGNLDIHQQILLFNENPKEGEDKFIQTTPGRVKLFSLMPKHDNLSFSDINECLKSGSTGKLFSKLYDSCGQKYVAEFSDIAMRVGFDYATKSGISFALSDLYIPDEKYELIEKTNKQVEKLHEQYLEGLITENERYNKVQDIWIKCIQSLSDIIIGGMSVKKSDGLQNDIYTMIDSGARGTKQQLMHMIGMRGLIAKTSGAVLEHPVKECYKEGLHIGSFFYTIHGVRKGFADTALRTAVAGYLTRRLVDVAQDYVVKELDCGTDNGLWKRAVKDGESVIAELSEAIVGRYTAKDISDSKGNLLVPANTLITKDIVKTIDDNHIEEVCVRSVITCDTRHGVCVKCYGKDLGRNSVVSIGTAVGVIAAQSISEPGTQLTLRTFHSGGGAKKDIEASSVESPADGIVKFTSVRTITNRHGMEIVTGKGMNVVVYDPAGKKELGSYELSYGAQLLVKDGDKVTKDQKLAEWEPYMIPIISEFQGVAKFRDLIDGVSLKYDEENAGGTLIVTDWRRGIAHKDLRPAIQLVREDESPIVTEYGAELKYYLDVDTTILVKDGEMIQPGDVVAKFSRGQLRSGDITGGLPMVSELFEARRPKNAALLAEIDGIVRFTKDYRSHRRIVLEPSDPDKDVSREYVLPVGVHLLVQEGYAVHKGDMLTDGRIYASDLLRILGFRHMTDYFINSVQSVYRGQGIGINDKHIEMIIKPMLQSVEITDPGDTTYLIGERVDKYEIEAMNEKTKAEGGRVAHYIPYMQGISDRSLGKSGLASAAFQDSIKYMLSAACQGQVDHVSTHVKTAMMTANLVDLGTGNYIYRMHDKLMDKMKIEEEQMEEVMPEINPEIPAESTDVQLESESLPEL